MQEYPHHYVVSAEAPAEGVISVSSNGLETLPSLAPAEFGGPGDLWSPETFLVAAVADCFILTFRAVARGSRFDWNSVECEVDGVLDRVERVTCFTEFHMRVTLHVPEGTDVKKAERLVEKSDHVCLVTNSLTADTILSTEIVVDS
ncbi:MAG: OsmC family protein [Xanthomonadales bacterium]|nr:OsmC family protein [Gammaproteobacteria bacterium]MBT8053893.1 OsmC family protein [Gammaproteobacteria bacterium]NND55994.1 OsmC family protein [Xanthomonadales bacterium]NNK52055.1 OsmC family protein [Xanthomonadales bacterium]